jgi:hypothetical protein
MTSNLLPFPSRKTLYGLVREELKDLRTCSFSELEFTQDEDTVVVQFPHGMPGQSPDYHRRVAVRMLLERGYACYGRDTLSLVVTRAPDRRER